MSAEPTLKVPIPIRQRLTPTDRLLRSPARIMSRKIIATPEAPKAVGPYSQAVAVGNMLFCSGQIPLQPATGALLQGDVTEQTTLVLENLGAVLRANQMTYANVVKTTVFLTDLGDFAAMNDVYALYFPSNQPARSTIQVAALPKGARVEIEATAVADAPATVDLELGDTV